MSHFSHISMEASGRVAQGMALGVMAVDTFGREIRRERARAASDVTELALRLQEARRDQHVAMRRAAALERTLADSTVEIAQLRAELRRERAFSGELRDILGV